MTQEEIQELVNQANEEYGWGVNYFDIEKFAYLVAAKEREACANICEKLGVYPELNVVFGGPDWYKHGKDCAAAIRARGEQA